MASPNNVFDWLDQVRERPGMYAWNATELHMLVRGYYTALRHHGIQEYVPDMSDKFRDWAHIDTRWEGFNCGWGYAFDHNTPKDADPITHFFTYVDRYRLLKPTVTATVSLSPEHVPTGRRCIIGIDGRMERPNAISVVNYAPTQLNHLRHHYSERVDDDRFLILGDGSHQTKLSDLLDWVADEFGVSHDDWETTRTT